MRSCAVVSLLLICNVAAVVVAETPAVKTKLGKIVGTSKQVSVFGKQMKIDRFLGIPYAQPPTRNLRFQKPVAKNALTSDGSPFLATKFGNTCYQLNMLLMGNVTYSEDCLFLNVYAPTERKGPLAVMIWIHGGGLSSGTSDHYVSDTLASYGDVIVVTINYRLTLWGFLSTGDENAPGNLGFWDQHLAIKWVHDNIAAFGGDPERVTLFGESAGGVSVIFQSLYAGSKGLFQRAIAQSGSMTVTGMEPKNDVMRLGKLVGCEQTESGPLVQCLQGLSAELLDETLNNFTNGLLAPPFPFQPTIDGEFFREEPRDLLKSENKEGSVFSGIDFMSGICAEEGVILLTSFAGVNDPEQFEPNQTSFKDFISGATSFVLNNGEPLPDAIGEVVAHEYTDWSDPYNKDTIRTKSVQIMSDMFFIAPMLQALSKHASMAENSKGTYMYSFEVVPPVNFMPTPSWFKNATHGDELPYEFFEEESELLQILPGHEGREFQDWERDVAKYIITLFTNFAKTGNPNKPQPVKREWPVYTNEEQQYFRILQDQSADPIGSHLIRRESNLWNKIIPTLLTALKETTEKQHVQDQGYCEKDGGCDP